MIIVMYLAQTSKATCTGAASLQTQVQYRSPITTHTAVLKVEYSSCIYNRYIKVEWVVYSGLYRVQSIDR